MRLIFHSTIPSVGVGYGVLTKELVTRMIADGHQVKVSTKHHLGTSYVINGIEVFEGVETGLVNKVIAEENYDYLISAMDNWTLSEPFSRWIASVFLDTQYIHTKMITGLKGSLVQLAPTKHCEEELKRVGFEPRYAPFGVDTKLFRPDEKIRNEYREKKKWDKDTFVIGLVGINYATDRKNIIGTIRAFQRFNIRHPNSVLYLHTDMMGSATQGQPLLWVKNACGFDDNNMAVQYVDQKRYHLWQISQDELVGLYNAIDVFCLPTKGEGFGLPLVEAQACSCPVIVTEATSGKELCKGGWCIPIRDDQMTYSSLLTWIQVATVSDIDEHMEKAYKAWEDGSIKDEKIKAREGMFEYDWDNVYQKYWQPLLKDLEKKPVAINNVPKYIDLYKNFDGRLLMVDCKEVCKNSSVCDKKFPSLYGEPDNPADRNILSRSYPIIPSLKEGEYLVDTSCSLYRYLTPKFINSCKENWEKLFGYPRVRQGLEKIWNEMCGNENVISLDSIKEHPFDEEYSRILQSKYRTTFDLQEVLPFKSGSTILDIGAGKGDRVQMLRDLGYEAMGTEINSSLIDFNRNIIYGDAEKLQFSDNTFDVVCSIDVLEHMKNPIQAIKEMFRVSKDLIVVQITPTEDGCFLEDPTHIVHWDLERWKRELAECGDIEKTLIGCGFVMRKKKSE